MRFAQSLVISISLLLLIGLYTTQSEIRSRRVVDGLYSDMLRLVEEQLDGSAEKLLAEAQRQTHFESLLARLNQDFMSPDSFRMLTNLVTKGAFQDPTGQSQLLGDCGVILKDEIREFQMRGEPALWGKLENLLLLLFGMCTLGLVLAFHELRTRSRTIEQTPLLKPDHSFSSGDNGPTSLPISFTQLALRAQSKAGEKPVSGRGYTERILHSISNLLILTSPSGRIQMVNHSVSETLGYSQGELLGSSLADLVPSQEDSLDSQLDYVEVEFVTKSGVGVPILATCSVVVNPDGEVDGLVIVGQDITEQKQSAHALLQSRTKLSLLMERLVSAQESERQKLARDLHDGLLQQVIATEFQLSAFKSRAQKADTEFASPELESASEYLQEAIREGRSLIRGLRPPTLDRFGLEASAKHELDKLNSEPGIDAEFQSDLGSVKLSASLENVAFRICQEALNNIRKHAGPCKVRVELNGLEDKLLIRVSDWGCGFEVNADSESVGVLGMRERAEFLGGSLSVSSRPGGGTQVIAEIPYKVSDAK